MLRDLRSSGTVVTYADFKDGGFTQKVDNDAVATDTRRRRQLSHRK